MQLFPNKTCSEYHRITILSIRVENSVTSYRYSGNTIVKRQCETPTFVYVCYTVGVTLKNPSWTYWRIVSWIVSTFDSYSSKSCQINSRRHEGNPNEIWQGPHSFGMKHSELWYEGGISKKNFSIKFLSFWKHSCGNSMWRDHFSKRLKALLWQGVIVSVSSVT